MTDFATLDEFGALTDPGTLKIERLLPAPSSACGRISRRVNCAASGWRRARWR